VDSIVAWHVHFGRTSRHSSADRIGRMQWPELAGMHDVHAADEHSYVQENIDCPYYFQATCFLVTCFQVAHVLATACTGRMRIAWIEWAGARAGSRSTLLAPQCMHLKCLAK
jgi:hypothetical protein